MNNMQLPRMTQVNKILIIVSVVCFLLQSILNLAQLINLNLMLGLSAQLFWKGLFYQLLTYPLAGGGLIEVVFNALLLWFIGCELENSWGRKRYLAFLTVATLGGGIVFLALSQFISGVGVLGGLAGITSALLLAYAIIYPHRTFLFLLIIPVKAKYFCMILIGMQFYMGIFSPGASQVWGHLGAMFFTFLFMLYLAREKRPKKKGKGKLSLVSDEVPPPKYWN